MDRGEGLRKAVQRSTLNMAIQSSEIWRKVSSTAANAMPVRLLRLATL